MNINLTLIGQTIAFFFFVWFCMKFIWPPVIHAMRARQKRIADGLLASEQAEAKLLAVQQEADRKLEEAREQAREIIAGAQKRAVQIEVEAEENGKQKAMQMEERAHAAMEREVHRAREMLRTRLASLVHAGVRKILEESVDAKKHAQFLDRLSRDF